MSQFLDYVWVLSFKFMRCDSSSLDTHNILPKLLQYFYHCNKSPCLVYVSLLLILYLIIRITTLISKVIIPFDWLKIYNSPQFVFIDKVHTGPS